MLLNLGCGTKTSDDPVVLNVDWSVMLRLRRNPIVRRVGAKLVSDSRRARFDSLPDNILVADLSKGVPLPDGSATGVYHSHLLEHLDEADARSFFEEVRRVLAAGGIHRTAVPDFELLCRAYLERVAEADAGQVGAEIVVDAISETIEQMVRRVPWGTSQQTGLRRAVEMRLLGDARRRGETHQWMYDRHTLVALYESCGFTDVRVRRWNESSIDRWSELGLELEDGVEYKPGSLYVEGVRP